MYLILKHAKTCNFIPWKRNCSLHFFDKQQQQACSVDWRFHCNVCLWVLLNAGCCWNFHLDWCCLICSVSVHPTFWRSLKCLLNKMIILQVSTPRQILVFAWSISLHSTPCSTFIMNTKLMMHNWFDLHYLVSSQQTLLTAPTYIQSSWWEHWWFSRTSLYIFPLT